MTTTLTKTETVEFLNEIEEIYEKPVAYQLRASSKWVTKDFKDRTLLGKSSYNRTWPVKKSMLLNLKIPIHHRYIISGLNVYG